MFQTYIHPYIYIYQVFTPWLGPLRWKWSVEMTKSRAYAMGVPTHYSLGKLEPANLPKHKYCYHDFFNCGRVGPSIPRYFLKVVIICCLGMLASIWNVERDFNFTSITWACPDALQASFYSYVHSFCRYIYVFRALLASIHWAWTYPTFVFEVMPSHSSHNLILSVQLDLISWNASGPTGSRRGSSLPAQRPSPLTASMTISQAFLGSPGWLPFWEAHPAIMSLLSSYTPVLG